MPSTAFLLLLFALGIAYATFIESRYGTATARILVYNALWMEILLSLLTLNLAGSIFVNRLLTRDRWPVALFHLSFLLILAGAAITRYTGSEGTLHIREGEQTDSMITESAYVSVVVYGYGDTLRAERKVLFSPYTANRFRETLHPGGKKVVLENLAYVPSATEMAAGDPEGEPLLSLFAVGGDNPGVDFVLRENQSRAIGSLLFGFNLQEDSAGIRISAENGTLLFMASDTVLSAGMGGAAMQKLLPGEWHPLAVKTIYRSGDAAFVLKEYMARGKVTLGMNPDEAGKGTADGLRMALHTENDRKEFYILGRKGVAGTPVIISLDSITLSVSYGSLIRPLPFTLRLHDFQIERYPGSRSPSSFASEVTLTGEGGDPRLPFRIFMNNILKYKGYRLFQSSYDPDEKGTILSVNADPVGTPVTYCGYALMTAGMVLTLFSRRSRFRSLGRQLARLSAERKKLYLLPLFLLLLVSSLRAAGEAHDQPVSLPHAGKFGELLLQNSDGRIEPVNTMASEILRKVARANKLEGREPVQLMLEILVNPERWQHQPLIRVAEPVRSLLPSAAGGYVSVGDLLDPSTGTYKLRKQVEEAYSKNPAARNRFDKEIINVDERANVLISWMNGNYLTLFPLPGDSSLKWLSLPDALQSDNQEVAAFSRTVFSRYVSAVQSGMVTGDYSDADQALDQLKTNQKTSGRTLYPSIRKIRLEIFYVNFNLYTLLSRLYLILGLAMLAFQLGRLFSARPLPAVTGRAGLWIVGLLFALHTAGLAVRWYITGHAPWSNGYETLLYISWATCLSGLVFAARSPMTPAITTLLSGISLLVAGMSWMNPELTNLVPVLKSYWLVIHVAVITASYGFFAMAALAGLLNLVLLLVRSGKHQSRIELTLREMELILGMTVTAGLFLLTVGSFLGGVWANESWGRYWGWDPKETWAMVTILVYGFVAHMHRIPLLRGVYALSVASLIGFASVLMTFFGVNYYLSGLHSYAGGEPVPLPPALFIALFLVIALALSAFFAVRSRKLVTSGKQEPPS